MTTLSLCFKSRSGEERQDVTISQTIIAGWTGRDPVAVQRHIKELQELGVKPPATTPIFYRVSNSRLTTSDELQVIGTKSGGEVEYTILKFGGKYWVGAGSDHTDREVEAYGVTVSKQVCDKPIAPVFWPFEEVESHWDALIMRSYTHEGGKKVLYQEGPISGLLHPMEVIDRYGQTGEFSENTIMFGGTLAAIGGVRPTNDFAFEIEDPKLGRKIGHSYRLTILPILG